MLGRLVIDNVRPATPNGYPAKAAVGEPVEVTADVFRDGHDILAGRVRWRPLGRQGVGSRRRCATSGNDAWTATFVPIDDRPPRVPGRGVDRPLRDVAPRRRGEGGGRPGHRDRARGGRPPHRAPGQAGAGRRPGAPQGRRRPGCARPRARSTSASTPGSTTTWHRCSPASPIPTDLTRGAAHRAVGRPGTGAAHSAWYEFFPRSEGGFDGARKRLPAIAEMGFDVVYLPPIHPIGRTARKGRNNTLDTGPERSGQPVGDRVGGGRPHRDPSRPRHDRRLRPVRRRGRRPTGSRWRSTTPCSARPTTRGSASIPSGSTTAPTARSSTPRTRRRSTRTSTRSTSGRSRTPTASRSGTRARRSSTTGSPMACAIFRVDNPHTKPFAFWEWLLAAPCRPSIPTSCSWPRRSRRPRSWRSSPRSASPRATRTSRGGSSKWELQEYLTELSSPPLVDYFRPNFWPNTPDILSGPLRNGSLGAFRAAVRARRHAGAELRHVLRVRAGRERAGVRAERGVPVLREVRGEAPRLEQPQRRSRRSSRRVNEIRRRHPAFGELRTIQFHWVDNDHVIAYSKRDRNRQTDTVVCIVSLDPDEPVEATVTLDLAALGLGSDERIRAARRAHRPDVHVVRRIQLRAPRHPTCPPTSCTCGREPMSAIGLQRRSLVPDGRVLRGAGRAASTTPPPTAPATCPG